MQRWYECGHCEWGQHGVASRERCMCQCHPRQNTSRKSKPKSGEGRRRIVKALLARDGRHCYWCHVQFKGLYDPTVEHLIPRARGGGNNMENLVLACDWCNQKRGIMTIREFRAWLAKNWVSPEHRRQRARL